MRKSLLDPKELVLWISPLLLFAPGFMGNKVFYWGTILLQFVPWRHIALELMRDGSIPLWNPYSGMGAPLLANYQSALLYPPSWILLSLEAIGGILWSVKGHGVLLALHLGFCAVGMKRWLEELGIKKSGQMVGAIAFGLCGYLVSRASFQSILFSASWMPWIFLYTHRFFESAEKTRKRTYFWLVVVIAMNLLAGHAQTSWYILWATTAWLLARSFWGAHKTNCSLCIDILKNLFLWFSAIGWAILISAAQLFPTTEYLLNSQRSGGIEREFGLMYSFWPWRFLSVWMPNFFGNPAQGNYWGYANYWEDAVYSGSMALFLAIYALIRSLGKSLTYSTENDRPSLKFTVSFWWLMSGAAMILALGKNLPFYSWLLDQIPGFDLFQAPTRVSLVAQFGLATLAGIGVELWESPRGWVRYWTRLGTAGFVSMFLVSSFAYYRYSDFYPTIMRSFQQFGLSGFIFGIILLLKPNDHLSYSGEKIKDALSSSKVWGVIVFLFFLADLMAMGWGLNPVATVEIYQKSSVQSVASDEDSLSRRYFLDSSDEYEIKFEKFFRFDTFQTVDDWWLLHQAMIPNLNLLAELAMVNNFDPFVPARFADWLSAITETKEKGQEEIYHKLLKLSAVGTVIEMSGDELRFNSIDGDDRFRFYPCATIASNSMDALQAVLKHSDIGSKMVVLETDKMIASGSCEKNIKKLDWSILIQAENAHNIKLQVSTNQEGWLVMNDTFYPGWRVWVDGKQSMILPANSVFRAVWVEEGTHLVEFRYRPLSFAVGICLSLVAIAGLCFFRWYKIYNV